MSDLGPIIDLLRATFGIEAHGVERLAGEWDENYRVVTSGGQDHLLKLTRPSSDPDPISMQDSALAHLEAQGLDAPRHLGTETIVASDGVPRLARLLSWIPGQLWSDLTPDGSLLEALGRTVALTDAALATFDHPALDRPDRWNLLQADRLPLPEHGWANPILAGREPLLDALAELPQQPIHNDANENNIVIRDAKRDRGLTPWDAKRDRGLTLIDYGDLVRGPRLVGLGVAAAYSMLGQDDPLAAACRVVAGYHHECPLTPSELDLLDGVIRLRLAMSIANAAELTSKHPENEDYLSISQAPIASLVVLLEQIEPGLATASYRHACGYMPVAAQRPIEAFLGSASFDPAPLIDIDLVAAPIIDWSTDADELAELPTNGIALGRWRENRAVYQTDDFATPFGDRRTLHMGIDVFAPAATVICSPLDGVVHASEIRDQPGDYGGVILVEYRTADHTPFWLLFGHLRHASANAAPVGRTVRAGEPIAELGSPDENGGWPPHVHVQMYTDLLGKTTDIDGVARESQAEVWSSVSPNPAPLIIGADPVGVAAPRRRSAAEIVRRRRVKLSTSLSTSYREPLQIVRGDGAYLIDRDGNRWLDLVNNVAHVGHEHARVVAALTDQASRLNTNTRYLHPNIVDYAERLTGLFPDPLSVAFFTNSGSEAVDLALRLARTATGRTGTLVLDWAYHGNLNSLIEISPYKFNRSGGQGPSPRVGICELPDPYRGSHGSDGLAYAEAVGHQAASLDAAGHPAAAFVHESISGCGGQVDLAPGYLAAAYHHARSAGAVVIADEIQCGLGRVGDAWWAFEAQGAIPDIVTVGKPIGNGHPLGAVITTPEIALAFRNGMEYFNTFAGNPVSCAVGLAVLDVVRDERLKANAATVGNRLKEGLKELTNRHEIIGDVRGRGLFLGVDLVTDRDTREPATERAPEAIEGLKAQGILASTDGPGNNVIKIKPPMVLTAREADRVIESLDSVLARLGKTTRHG